MSDLNQGFGECTDCRVWSKIPTGFKEIRHFIRCPNCKNPMFLCRVGKPSDIGLKDSQEVIGSLMLHGEKL